jgi:ATP-dependent protease HslVU (ClpYQ) peptidase subunit
MTVIAFDGKTLAADKRANMGGYIVPVTKIRRINGMLFACAGDFTKGIEMFDWIERGSNPENLPAFQRTDDWVAMLCITEDGSILKYERGPFPLKVESPFFAMGSGRDFAVAAMYLGLNARQAVEVACQFEANCGNGVDTLELGE